MEDGHEATPTPHRHRRGALARLRANFLTGLVVIAPIGFTLWLIWAVVGWVDSWVWPFVPAAYHPDMLINRWFGNPNPMSPDHIAVNVRGIGVFVFLIFTVIVGWIAKGIIGRSLLSWGESMVDRMPVVRSIYGGVKQIAETVFAQSATNFDKACMIEYPRKGIWAIGFVSTEAKGEIALRIPEDEILTIFVPTTPNPTSGFLLYLSRRDVVFLDMSIEDAAKLVISAGLVYPPQRAQGEAPPPSIAAQ